MSLLVEQLITFGMLVGAGVVMAFIFDIYRVFRWLLKLPKLMVHFFDLVIWLAMAVVVFYLLILGNWGEVRFYVFLGLFCGLALYFKFCSKRAIKIILAILDFLKKLGKFLYKVFTFPIKIIGTILVVPLGIISFVLGKVWHLVLLPFSPLKKVGLKLFRNILERLKKLLRKAK